MVTVSDDGFAARVKGTRAEGRLDLTGGKANTFSSA
jgi:hypothetical protein